jgi:hypothetical protein
MLTIIIPVEGKIVEPLPVSFEPLNVSPPW